MEGSVSRITAYQGLQLVSGWCSNNFAENGMDNLQIYPWEYPWEIRKIHQNPWEIRLSHGYKDQNFVSTDISFTDTDTNGYGFIHILAFAYIHSAMGGIQMLPIGLH
jgi:hypothetical protein